MFIPRTSPVHQDLPTSYVLVDALVDFLCEGGFSGVVEVTGRRGECYIIVDKGAVSAGCLGDSRQPSAPATVAEIASTARTERGRVSVYECSSRAAGILRGRLAAEALYEKLSTDFADVDRMISKLAREKDREWYIEINSAGGASGLVHLGEDGAIGLSSNQDSPEGEAAQQYLLAECKKAGGTFDVYFRIPSAEAAQPVAATQPVAPVAEPQAAATGSPTILVSELETQSAPPLVFQPATEGNNGVRDTDPLGIAATIAASPSAVSQPAQPLIPMEAPRAPRPEHRFEAADPATLEGAERPRPRALTGTAALTLEEKNANRMAEIKQTLGTVVSTIETAALALEARDTFSIYLRAGQLKIADRYPFLDPFGSEFEYHAGEIVFVGKASPEVFISGLTEAIKLAVTSVIETSSQPARLRARLVDDVTALATQIKPELYKLGLNDTIEELLESMPVV